MKVSDEEIMNAYMQKSGCSYCYSRCNSKGFKMFRATFRFVYNFLNAKGLIK